MPGTAKGLNPRGPAGQVAGTVLGRRGGSPGIRPVIDKLALLHFSSASVTSHIMLK